MKKIISLVPVWLYLTACGGGVPDSAVVAELDEEEAQSVCEDFAADYPLREITCESDGFEFTIELGFEESDCGTSEFETPPEGCEATVGDWRACMDAMYAPTDEEICNPSDDEEGFPEECAPIFENEACVG